MHTQNEDFNAPKVNMASLMEENSTSNGPSKLIQSMISNPLEDSLSTIQEVQTKNAARVELIEMKTNALVGLINEQNKSVSKLQNYALKKLRYAEILLATSIVILFIGLYSTRDTKPVVATPIVKSKEFVSLKYLNLRTKPTKSAGKITMISPNQRVELIDQRLGWYKISYTDHAANKTFKGWVWSEFLKKI